MVENAEIFAHQLKGVAQVWFNQLKEERALDVCPLEMRETKVLESINLRQGNMSMEEYSLKFTQLAKCAPTMVADFRARMSKFVSGVFDLVVKECRTTMLIKEMYISHLIIHSQQI